MTESVHTLHIRRQRGESWPHRFALLTAGATFLLIGVGGIVTSTGTGLAVPDWPTTFGHNMFLYPWSKMVGGIFYEHSHRLIGAGVGLLTLILALLLWFCEPRGWLRWLGVVAVSAVIVQGVLGGLRVVLLERTLAIVHAAMAQAFFALMASLVFFTSEEGRKDPRKIQAADAGRLRRLSLLTTGVIYLQLILGAVLRHTGVGIGAHLLWAGVVSVQIFSLAVLIRRGHADEQVLIRPVGLLGGLLMGQLLLGLGSYLGQFTSLGAAFSPFIPVALTTAHVATGALMLGTCLVLTLRVYRLLVPPAPAIAREFVSASPGGRSGQAPA